jgi:hypothetical protein
MRTKLLALFLTVSAVLALGVGAAGATGTVTLTNEKEEAVEVGTNLSLANVEFNSNAGWTCSSKGGSANVAANGSDPAVLDQVGITMNTGCIWAGMFPFTLDVDAPEGITLNADGTGEMPVQLDQFLYLSGKHCYYKGTLDVTWTKGSDEIEFAGVPAVTGSGCQVKQVISGSLQLQDEEGGSVTVE